MTHDLSWPACLTIACFVGATLIGLGVLIQSFWPKKRTEVIKRNCQFRDG